MCLSKLKCLFSPPPPQEFTGGCRRRLSKAQRGGSLPKLTQLPCSLPTGRQGQRMAEQGHVPMRANVGWWGLLCREHEEQGKREHERQRNSHSSRQSRDVGAGKSAEKGEPPQALHSKARASLLPPTSHTHSPAGGL